MPKKTIEVVLEEAEPKMSGNAHYFVCIANVPWAKGMVITRALPRRQAERIKADVEQALHDYRKPRKRAPRKAKTAWARIERGVLP